MKKTIGIVLMSFLIMSFVTGCEKQSIKEVTIQEETTEALTTKDLIMKEAKEEESLAVEPEKEVDEEIMSLEEQEKNAKQMYDYFFEDYSLSFRNMYKDTNMYVSGDGTGFKPTLFYEGLTVEDKEFFASIIYYDDSMFLYIQSNNGEDIDKEIPNPTDYIKKGIDFECKEWQRYDLSKSYLYSMKKGNDDILEYLSSVLP